MDDSDDGDVAVMMIDDFAIITTHRRTHEPDGKIV